MGHRACVRDIRKKGVNNARTMIGAKWIEACQNFDWFIGYYEPTFYVFLPLLLSVPGYI